jgi:hypothetical protein
LRGIRTVGHALSQVLFDVAEAVRVAAILLPPIMPGSAAEILRQVGEERRAADIRLSDAEWRPGGERGDRQGGRGGRDPEPGEYEWKRLKNRAPSRPSR